MKVLVLQHLCGHNRRCYRKCSLCSCPFTASMFDCFRSLVIEERLKDDFEIGEAMFTIDWFMQLGIIVRVGSEGWAIMAGCSNA